MARDLEKKRAYEREWRKRKYANDPAYKARKKATDLRWQKALAQKVKDLKLSLGCARCGYNKCARALQFHHTNGNKEFDISSIVSSANKGWDKIELEIKKCELLCANCHAEEHDKGD